MPDVLSDDDAPDGRPGDHDFDADITRTRTRERSNTRTRTRGVEQGPGRDDAVRAPTMSPRGRGGARNRADRLSLNLTRQQVEGMVAAAAFSDAKGFRFQRHWTVHYERAGIADRDGAAFVRQLLKVAGQTARREGGEMTALWVRENGHGKGAHVHILLYLPPECLCADAPGGGSSGPEVHGSHTSARSEPSVHPWQAPTAIRHSTEQMPMRCRATC